MYFKNFKNIVYEFEISGEKQNINVVDITTNIRIRKQIFNNIELYDSYYIKDGETPEIIAEIIYGDPQLHWIIMLANDKYDYLNDFPISFNVLDEIILEEYASELDTIRHWEDDKGNILSTKVNYNIGTPITNREFEYKLNEDKRSIRLPNPNLVSQILRQLKEMLL